MVSHELRSPLQAVLGVSELLLHSELEPCHEKLVRTMDASGKSLLGLVDNLLEISRLEFDPPQLKHTPFDFRNLVMDVVDLLTVRAREHNTSIDVAVEDPESWVFVGDEDRIRQVLLNIVGNAVKYTCAGNVKLYLRRTVSEIGCSGRGVKMPLMDGYETTRAIRKRDRFAQLPIVALTASAYDHVEKKCVDAGMDGYLTKPMAEQTLVQELRLWLEPQSRHQIQAEAARASRFRQTCRLDSNIGYPA